MFGEASYEEFISAPKPSTTMHTNSSDSNQTAVNAEEENGNSDVSHSLETNHISPGEADNQSIMLDSEEREQSTSNWIEPHSSEAHTADPSQYLGTPSECNNVCGVKMLSKKFIDHLKNCHGIMGTLCQISKQIPPHPESIYLQPSLVQNNLICLDDNQDYIR